MPAGRKNIKIAKLVLFTDTVLPYYVLTFCKLPKSLCLEYPTYVHYTITAQSRDSRRRNLFSLKVIVWRTQLLASRSGCVVQVHSIIERKTFHPYSQSYHGCSSSLWWRAYWQIYNHSQSHYSLIFFACLFSLSFLFLEVSLYFNLFHPSLPFPLYFHVFSVKIIFIVLPLSIPFSHSLLPLSISLSISLSLSLFSHFSLLHFLFCCFFHSITSLLFLNCTIYFLSDSTLMRRNFWHWKPKSYSFPDESLTYFIQHTVALISISLYFSAYISLALSFSLTHSLARSPYLFLILSVAVSCPLKKLLLM